MSFPTLSDPVHIARAHAAFEIAWNDLKSSDCWRRDDNASIERLQTLIECYVYLADDEKDLAKRAAERFRSADAKPPRVT